MSGEGRRTGGELLNEVDLYSRYLSMRWDLSFFLYASEVVLWRENARNKPVESQAPGPDQVPRTLLES
jgi:hypothetical protein